MKHFFDLRILLLCFAVLVVSIMAGVVLRNHGTYAPYYPTSPSPSATASR